MYCYVFFFFFNDTATTEIYTLSLHDALPIWKGRPELAPAVLVELVDRLEAERTPVPGDRGLEVRDVDREDRKSTRLNSSHANISYAVFCLKKKKNNHSTTISYTC